MKGNLVKSKTKSLNRVSHVVVWVSHFKREKLWIFRTLETIVNYLNFRKCNHFPGGNLMPTLWKSLDFLRIYDLDTEDSLETFLKIFTRLPYSTYFTTDKYSIQKTLKFFFKDPLALNVNHDIVQQYEWYNRRVSVNVPCWQLGVIWRLRSY